MGHPEWLSTDTSKKKFFWFPFWSDPAKSRAISSFGLFDSKVYQIRFVTLNILGSYLLFGIDYNFWTFPRSPCARGATICHLPLVTSRHVLRVKSGSLGEHFPACPWGQVNGCPSKISVFTNLEGRKLFTPRGGGGVDGQL